VLGRDAIKAEGISGGFSSVYEVLKAMEDAGRVRRGYFVEGLGAAQFLQPGIDERLRGERSARPDTGAVLLASSDPASPFGLSLPWPASSGRPMRAPGANVVIASDGRLLAWLARTERSILTFFREAEHERDEDARAVAIAVQRALERGQRRVLLFAQIDGEEAERTVLGHALRDAGFQATARGLLKRGFHEKFQPARDPDPEPASSSASDIEDELD
jgi:ATP-dependent Lhr-like helicase